MRLKLWLALSILALSACRGNLPPRPEFDVCRVSLARNGCLCSKPAGVTYLLPWAECEAFVAFRPSEIFSFFDYVVEIERRLNDGCSIKSTEAQELMTETVLRYEELIP